MKVKRLEKVITALAANFQNTTGNLTSTITDTRRQRNKLQEQNPQLKHKLHLQEEKEQFSKRRKFTLEKGGLRINIYLLVNSGTENYT